MTAEQLKACSLKDLFRLAERKGVTGWRSMAKAQLVRALLRRTPKRTAPAHKNNKLPSSAARRRIRAARGKIRSPSHAGRSTAARGPKLRRLIAAAKRPLPVAKRLASPAAVRRLRQMGEKAAHRKNLAQRAGKFGTRDRLVAIVRDPFWIEARWELTPRAVARAEAALAQEWHQARPMLRLCGVATNGEASATEMIIRDIEVHGGVDHWYVDVQDPPQTYRLEIGYKVPSERFFILARSNLATTPRAGASDEIDQGWNNVSSEQQPPKHRAVNGRGSNGHDATDDEAELEALFEGRLRRPMSSSVFASAGLNGKKRKFSFDVDAEIIVFGSTDPSANVTLLGEPVRLRPDGTFTVRCSMPNCRQLIPAVARSADGIEQRTIVLSVERNTKTMEPLVRENTDQPPAAP